jgi:hypothetical protein
MLPSHWLPVKFSSPPENAIAFLPETESSDLQNIPSRNQVENQAKDLFIEKLFWQNRLANAREDSVVMAIDLVDSILTLELKGVILRTCRLQKFDLNIDPVKLKKHPNFTDWLEDPFILQYDSSSIRKKLFKIIQAPKDSIEAEEVIRSILKNGVEEDIYYSLHFGRHLRIDISQYSLKELSQPQYSNLFYFDDQSIDLLTRVFSPNTRSAISAELRIDIQLSHSDARAIYRAIPKHTALAIRL